MLQLLFSFRGEVGRGKFLLGLAISLVGLFVFGIAFFVLAYITLTSLGDAGRLSPAAYAAMKVLAVPVTVLIFAGPYFWNLAALTVKRARCVGWPPFATTGAWFVAGPVSGFLFYKLTGVRPGSPFSDSLSIGGLVQIAVWLLLLALPSKNGGAPACAAARPSRGDNGLARNTFGLRN